MRVIIRCAGSGSRWDNYQGVPKHLVKLCGEPLLDRMVRITRDVAPDADIKVVVPDLSDRRYMVPGSTRSTDKPTPTNGDIDKILSSSHLWGASDRTAVIWGDTFWEEAALADLLTAEVDDWHAWLRIAGAGGELFGFVWQAHMNERIAEACRSIIEMRHAGQLKGAGYDGYEVRGGWALYRVLSGVEIDDHADHGHSTIVDGWTEDMDTPRDWDEWCLRWAKAPVAQRPAKR